MIKTVMRILLKLRTRCNTNPNLTPIKTATTTLSCETEFLVTEKYGLYSGSVTLCRNSKTKHRSSVQLFSGFGALGSVDAIH